MSKSMLYPKSAKDIKGKTAIAELIRAHFIIIFLALAMIPLLWIGSIAPIQFDMNLSAVSTVLLAFLALASLGIIIRLKNNK